MKHIFAPYEMFFCGRSGSGKTFLLRRLTQHLHDRAWRVAYVKHDAHRFEMDRSGKDTHHLWQAGAASVCISDAEHSAAIVREAFTASASNALHQSSDIVLIEGYKSLAGRKIVFLHPDGDWQTVLNLDNVAAVIGASDLAPPNIYPEVPYFQRDDVQGIAALVLREMDERVRRTPIYGLVLAGGRSQRMKTDKAWLAYEGRPQIARIYDELTNVCEKVFVSCRDQQWAFPADSEEGRFMAAASLLPDRLINFGPLGGILSAMLTYPDAAFLVCAVDMPFLRDSDLQTLAAARHAYKAATCFVNPENGMVEPLCGIYEPKLRGPLLDALGRGFLCPRKILSELDIVRVSPRSMMTVANINHPNEYQSAAQDSYLTEG